ncbi:hypothetical protein BD769DRAFT_1711877 [Suillus cothurnatus]|nr:hypothetical protein BD769DRAFT_1728906 [Suillus cothurnatus]KAG2089199.1 hypothetical protein BD769DRAFT_1711877 [Suillus cothurnatus]
MTTATTKNNPKAAEFARLFELFDRIATRRARGSTEIAISTDDIQSVPAEFAPVLKNLSAVLSLRAQRDQVRLHKPTGRPRRNTVGVAPTEQNTIDVAEDLAAQTLEDHYDLVSMLTTILPFALLFCTVVIDNVGYNNGSKGEPLVYVVEQQL